VARVCPTACGVALLFMLVSHAATSAAATYVVTASGGDFAAIQPALNVAVAGDTVLVHEKATPYFEKLVFPASGSAGGGFITKRGTTSRRNQLTRKWSQGDATTLADFGDPVGGTTSYTLCLCDTSGGTPSLRLRAALPSGGTCGRRPCWKPSGMSALRYRDRERTWSGIASALLRARLLFRDGRIAL